MERHLFLPILGTKSFPFSRISRQYLSCSMLILERALEMEDLGNQNFSSNSKDVTSVPRVKENKPCIQS
uniref:Putative ovule protein n=1 Tax=Solanum chacoense TaxID=4108 RepID=A0A0V0HRV0_SOLCH